MITVSSACAIACSRWLEKSMRSCASPSATDQPSPA
jgi:hypothetical protein